MNLSKSIKAMAVAGASAMAMAVAMVKPFEGVEYKPYYDVVGVLTVCYGHTGGDIIRDKVYTKEECNALLEKDLGKVKNQVDQIIKPALPETARAAIYSFVYNVGIGNFSRSTMLKKLNRGDLPGACDELKRWVYAGGKKWKGLINRRQIEEAVCEMELNAK